MKIDSNNISRINKIPLAKPWLGEEELKSVKETFSSGWVAGFGPKSEELGKKMENKYGFKHAIPVSNCTSALHLSLILFGIGKEDEVLVSDYSFPASSHSIKYVGATPVFVDVNSDTYNIDTEDLERKITNKTKAIICVHIFGQMCDMGKVVEIAKKHNLKLIEDCACAIGATYDGKYSGTFGDAACFSFHARKNITSGEGGLLVLKEEKDYALAKRLASFGQESAYSRQEKQGLDIPVFTELGYNYKLSDIQSGILLAQLKKYDQVLAKRKELVDYYNQKLKEIDVLNPPFVSKKCGHVYQSYVCTLNDSSLRDKLILYLKEKGIYAQIGTYSCCIQPVYNTPSDCTKSIEVYKKSIALPLYYELEKTDIDRIVDEIKNFGKMQRTFIYPNNEEQL